MNYVQQLHKQARLIWKEAENMQSVSNGGSYLLVS